MNQHYQDALAGLNEMVKLKERGVPTSEATAMTAVLTRATLAVAEEQAKTNEHLELANLIAYAQLRRDRRRPSMATEELVDQRMAAFPEISAELTEDDEDL
ncbi:MAG TPA: hypothetical protein VF867_14060 [Arthrobacter sp.]